MFLRILILFPLLLPTMVSGYHSHYSHKYLRNDVEYIKEQIGSMSEMNRKMTENDKKMTEMKETLFQIKETVEKLGSGQDKLRNQNVNQHITICLSLDG